MLKLPTDTDLLLVDFIKENRLVDASLCDEAVANHNGAGVVGPMLDAGKITEEAIADKLSELYHLKRTNIQPSMLENRPMQDVLTNDFIVSNRIVPLSEENNTLRVLIADPNALTSENDVRVMTGHTVETLVTTLSELDKCTHALLNASSNPSSVANDSNPNAANDDKGMHHAKMPETGSEVIDFVNNVVAEAVALGVSDVHFEMFRESARVRFRLHGVLQDMEQFNEFLTYNYSATVTRLKIMASLDISERRLPQDGAISTEVGDKVIDIRVSSLPTVYGERVVLRILDPDAANFELDELGLDAHEMKNFRKAIHSPQGMMLVTGPTGSGKTTTLYAVLKELNQIGTNILTAEDPVEYNLHGIGQTQIRDSIGLSFASALRSFLRQDPEVIMVGEIRDKETSDIAIKAALTGHMVLSTLHTNDAPSTITRQINMGIPNYLISAALIMVVAQRLARVNCEHCKEVVDDPTIPETLHMLGFDEKEAKSLKVYKGKGCDHCVGTGIKGRRAIYEILPVSLELKEAILENAPESKMREIAKKDGFKPMQETGRQLIRDGIITIEEYQRILTLD